MFAFYKNWMEFFFVVLMAIGVIIALSSPSAVISYVIIFLAGIFAGRLLYERKHKIQLPYIMIIVGFVAGYLLGVYYGSRQMVIILFVVGAVAGYKLYDKKILKDAKY
ncbi:hypothetical protein HYX08_05260 [Candidatus Woesearchaeota archaeon]|nr:hypothetical protein [Candidatus Woesearchaeota archaeon]